MKLDLSNAKYTHQRSLVTLLDIIGNIGGFNDAIWLCFSTFLSSYSSLMYMRSVSKKIQFSSSKGRKSDNERDETEVGEVLSKLDLKRIISQLKNTFQLNLSPLKTVIFSCCCKRNKKGML